jgi:hypothetical protein
MPTAAQDASFFQLIHNLLTSQQRPARRTATKDRADKKPTERRRGNRRTYSCWQLLAWNDGKRPSPQADFHLVQCHDLSPQGFAFFSDSLPRRKQLIIALGNAPFVFFEAEVVRQESARRERVNGYLLGCRFVQRLESPPGLPLA